MPPRTANYGSPYPSAAAAARAEWWIDGSAGNDRNPGTEALPLLTDRERAKRVGDLPTSVPVVVYFKGALASTDYITVPANGPGGSITFYGRPQTPTTTGTLTGAAAATGNTPATMTDTTVNWSTLLTSRMRVDGGANVGAVAFPARDLTSGVAEYASAIVPDPAGYEVKTLAIGDTFVVEPLATALAVRLPYPTIGEPPVGTTVARVIFRDMDLSGATPIYVPHQGKTTDVAFYGCAMGPTSGPFTAIACSFPADTVFDSGAQTLRGCVLRGSPVIDRGADADWGGNTLVTGGTGARVKGSLLVTGPIRFCNSAGAGDGIGDGLVIDPSGLVITEAGGVIGGAGNERYGLRLRNGAQFRYSAGGMPTLTGTANGDMAFAGSYRGYGSILYGSPWVYSADTTSFGPIDDTSIVPSPVAFVPAVTTHGILPGETRRISVVTLPINGPNLIVAANAVGAGFNAKFLDDFTYEDNVTITILGYAQEDQYYAICSYIFTADAPSGKLYALGASNAYAYPSGFGLDIIAVISYGAGGTLPLPPLVIICYQ